MNYMLKNNCFNPLFSYIALICKQSENYSSVSMLWMYSQTLDCE